MTPGRARWRDERGQAGGMEMLSFGFLIFVVVVLLVANAWAVVDAKAAVVAAAREAARTFVETDDLGAARQEAYDVIEAHGRNPDRVQSVEPTQLERTFGRCRLVEFRVVYTVPALTLPWIGGFGDGIEVSARHSERVDPFREGAGTGGPADCPDA